MKKDEDKAGRGRLLDAWQSHGEGTGEPIGCLATTFTFQAAFFEEQCLARFLGMATDPQEQDAVHGTAAYLIEREERLAVVYAGVLIDRRHAQAAERSLRWDALPVRVRGALMHAKVSLLAWTGCVRLIIGSANLTEIAYRKNLEVYGVLDFSDLGASPLSELWKTIDFLNDVLMFTPAGAAQKRAADFLRRVRSQAKGWKQSGPRRSDTQVAVVLGGRFHKKEHAVLRAVREEVWPDKSPPRRAWALSPFFDRDTEAEPNETALALRNALARHGEYEVNFDVAVDVEADGRRRISAPQSLKRTLPNAGFSSVLLEEAGEARSLHAKCLWLENERRAVYLVGSSNFTRAGMGVGPGAWNVEANLAYLALSGPSYDKLLEAYPHSEKLANLSDVIWEPVFDPDAEAKEIVLPLPVAFGDASFAPEGEGGTLKLRLDGEPPPRWWIKLTEETASLSDDGTWSASGKPPIIIVMMNACRPPSSLTVYWIDKSGTERRALWLVNVSDPDALPPPEALRDLSLETLLEVLTMARPLYEAVVRALQQAACRKQRGDAALLELDPHARVRTETFLLQRTRRVARALEQLRIRLERPAYTLEALRWRLRGPVGPVALARAIQREDRSAGEVIFLYAEIALTLGRITLTAVPGALSPRTIRGELKSVVRELRDATAEGLQVAPPDLRAYVERAYNEALK